MNRVGKGQDAATVLCGKYWVGKVRGVNQTPKGTPSGTGVSLTPTLLAEVWNDLDETEHSQVEQIVLDYVEAQQEVEVECKHEQYIK